MKGLEDYNKELLSGMRAGYTTGTCACAGAKAALLILLGRQIEFVRVRTPFGIDLDLEIYDVSINNDYIRSVSLAIKKYAGDDPDVTDGIYIYSKLSILDKLVESDMNINSKLEEAYLDRDLNINDKNKIFICGGIGIGKVTRKGLDRAVGESAINTTPRRMIREHLNEILKDFNVKGDILVEIYANEGLEISKKTFNKRLGIEGGISILGTSGIVKPMSKKALIETIRVELRARLAYNKYIFATVGNYGLSYIADKYNIDKNEVLEFSNYIGELIDMAVDYSCEGIILLGHIGKFIKLSGGIMNTHSNEADSRAELMAANLLKADINNKSSDEILNIAKRILSSNTSDEAIDILKHENILKEVMSIIAQNIYKYVCLRRDRAVNLAQKISDKHGENTNKTSEMKIAILSFNLNEGELLKIGAFDEILANIKKEK